MNLKNRTCLYFFCLAVFALGSCKNNNDAPGPEPVTNLNIMHLIPDEGSINFYSNGTRQNNYKLAYTEASGYLPVPGGQQIITIKDTLYNVLYTAPITLNDSVNYTMLITGQHSKNTVTGILIADTASVAGPGYARARIVNASPNSPALDVYFNNVAITNKTYKSVSGFTRIDTGKVIVNINLAGTNTIAYQVTLPQRLTPGVYTFYIYGLYGGTGTSGFNIGYIINQ